VALEETQAMLVLREMGEAAEMAALVGCQYKTRNLITRVSLVREETGVEAEELVVLVALLLYLHYLLFYPAPILVVLEPQPMEVTAVAVQEQQMMVVHHALHYATYFLLLH
jgi:hypothetical protein